MTDTKEEVVEKFQKLFSELLDLCVEEGLPLIAFTEHDSMLYFANSVYKFTNPINVAANAIHYLNDRTTII